ncbi:hypothetical protein [Bdellovibrio sp. ZAP7]|uniref:hypothetical protein n=1 Tax=Bdellovibrio sp. ZAP7 TaxID=2231053 RepID=UPI001157C6FE|nr:hypothetical protein [Bdellovibrio sp. ZAP7]
MMNSKQKIIVPVVVVLALAAVSLFILKQRAGYTGHFPDDMPDFNYTAEDKSKSDASGFLPTQMENPELFQAWAKNAPAMSECLDVEVTAPTAQEDLTLNALSRIVRNSFGEVLGVQNKWTVVDYKTKYGEIRRVYVEYSTDRTESLARRVQHFTILTSGKVRDIHLDKELTDNPTDEEIQNLSADGTVLATAKSSRINFANGDEINFVEKNGKVHSFIASHLGKYFRCENTDSEKMSCSCN